MGLQQLLNTIRKTNNKQFITNDKKHTKLQALIQQLPTTYTNKELTELDDLALSLKTRQTRNNNKTLQELIEQLDKKRTPYRGTQNNTLYKQITNKHKHYTNRFLEIEETLQTTPVTHDDLALTLQHLKTNHYLKQKAHKQPVFRRKKERIEQQLEKTLILLRTTPTYNFWKRYFTKQQEEEKNQLTNRIYALAA